MSTFNNTKKIVWEDKKNSRIKSIIWDFILIHILIEFCMLIWFSDNKSKFHIFRKKKDIEMSSIQFVSSSTVWISAKIGSSYSDFFTTLIEFVRKLQILNQPMKKTIKKRISFNCESRPRHPGIIQKIKTADVK